MHLLDHGNRVLLATLRYLALAAGVLAASKQSWLPASSVRSISPFVVTPELHRQGLMPLEHTPVG